MTALIAYANTGGEKGLRKLEMRMLEAGVTVSRTADVLSRYHAKLLIIDRRLLYVLSYNFTHLHIDHSRAFGIVTRKGNLVQEALKLLEADSDRKPYEAGLDTFLVSPVNARKQLSALIRRARKSCSCTIEDATRNVARAERPGQEGRGGQNHRVGAEAPI